MAKPGPFPAVCISYLAFVLFTTLVAGEALNVVEGNDGNLRGEGNYADIKIFYHSGSSTLTVKNAWINYGKWVPGKGNYHDEIGSPNGMTMTAWGEYHIASAGRQFSPSGTDASIDIYKGDERVLYLYWDVSFGGLASWKHREFSNGFSVKYTRIGESALLLTVVIVEAGSGGAEAA